MVGGIKNNNLTHLLFSVLISWT